MFLMSVLINFTENVRLEYNFLYKNIKMIIMQW